MKTKKNVIVVGGASGIGKATAEEYLSQNHNVVVFDYNKESLSTMESELNQDLNSLLFVHGDVRKIEDIKNTIQLTIQKFGEIDILIYSAGIFPDSLVLEMTEQSWDDVLNINLKGAFLFCQQVAQRMAENNVKGHILTISSGSYRSARIGSSHYCSSKAGLVMFTKVLAMEIASKGIKVNSISPGLIDNPRLDSNYKETFSSRIPVGRIGYPSDIASFIVSVTSLDNEYLTGQVIGIDGGMSTGQYGLPLSNSSV